MLPSIMMAPSETPTLSEAVTLIGCVPLTVALSSGLTIEVVGAVVSVTGAGDGVGAGVGDAVGLGVGEGGGGAGALVPDWAASSASKSTPRSVPSVALPLNGLFDDSL